MRSKPLRKSDTSTVMGSFSILRSMNASKSTCGASPAGFTCSMRITFSLMYFDGLSLYRLTPHSRNLSSRTAYSSLYGAILTVLRSPRDELYTTINACRWRIAFSTARKRSRYAASS